MVLILPARQASNPGEIMMKTFTTLAAICLFSLAAMASQADEMMSEEGMMENDMHESMESDMSMDEGMEMDEGMKMDEGMEMEEEMESEGM